MPGTWCLLNQCLLNEQARFYRTKYVKYRRRFQVSRTTGAEKWTYKKSWPIWPPLGVGCGWGRTYGQCLGKDQARAKSDGASAGHPAKKPGSDLLQTESHDNRGF